MARLAVEALAAYELRSQLSRRSRCIGPLHPLFFLPNVGRYRAPGLCEAQPEDRLREAEGDIAYTHTPLRPFTSPTLGEEKCDRSP